MLLYEDDVSKKKKGISERARSRKNRRQREEEQPYGKDVRLDGSPKPKVNDKRRAQKEKTKKRRR